MAVYLILLAMYFNVMYSMLYVVKFYFTCSFPPSNLMKFSNFETFEIRRFRLQSFFKKMWPVMTFTKCLPLYIN